MAQERVQRRLAAILAADVVGYSRLMEADETGTLDRLKTLRREIFAPIIADFGGRIFKLTGDGAFAEFASAVDAVNSAVAVQTALAERNAAQSDAKPLELRIGLSLGDVIVEGTDLYGNGVNVAARMEGLAEPGGICISGNVYEHVSASLEMNFEDLGDQSVKNIARLVRCYRVLLGSSHALEIGAQSAGSALRSPDKPSIAVLPFDNLSGDSEQEYFSDGMAEDLITDISKISGLFVVARNSSFAFKGQSAGVSAVADRLGVKHILEGSVRKMGDKLRVNVQLVDAASGGHIWAERYDGEMEDIFQFQDDIRVQIVAALQVSLTPADKALTKHKPTDSVEAYDHFLKGRANLYRFTLENVLEAKKSLETALELDANFADAYGFLSYCHFAGWILKLPGFDDTLNLANELAEKGVSLDGNSAIAVARLAWIQGWMRRFDQAIANFEKAISLAPHRADVYADFGQILNYWGDPERALELSEKVFSLDTFAPPLWEFYAGHSHFLMHQYDQALPKMTAMVERVPRFITGYAYLACLYVETDRLDDARDAIERLLEISPGYTLNDMDRIHPYRADDVRARFLDDLRWAGLPEGEEVGDGALSLPDKPSIAVLPFDNMSGDPEQEFFTDGLAEDIITALSKIERMRVIARHSTFAYRGQALDLRRIAEELGVRYLLEGSVRRGGSRLRITAQLIDANDGSHLWAEHYDRLVDDLFDIQDEITKEIVTSLRVKLTDGEAARVWARGTNNIEAWQYGVRAMELYRDFSPSGYLEARALAEKATELDPDYALAWAILGSTYWFDGRLGYTGDSDAKLARAAKLAERAMALDDSLSWSIGLSAVVAAPLGLYDEGVAVARRGIELYPGNADVRAFLAFALMFAGNFREAEEQFRTAMSLNPFYPVWYCNGLVRTLTFLDEFDEALTLGDEVLEMAPAHLQAWLHRAYIYGEIGRDDDASKAMLEIRRLHPDLRIRHMPRMLLVNDATATKRFIDGLRKAGLPE